MNQQRAQCPPPVAQVMATGWGLYGLLAGRPLRPMPFALHPSSLRRGAGRMALRTYLHFLSDCSRGGGITGMLPQCLTMQRSLHLHGLLDCAAGRCSELIAAEDWWHGVALVLLGARVVDHQVGCTDSERDMLTLQTFSSRAGSPCMNDTKTNAWPDSPPLGCRRLPQAHRERIVARIVLLPPIPRDPACEWCS
jgi:hypothetical protein